MSGYALPVSPLSRFLLALSSCLLFGCAQGHEPSGSTTRRDSSLDAPGVDGSADADVRADAAPRDGASDAAPSDVGLPDAPPMCPAETTACSDGCRDLMTHAAHCGACDRPCAAGELCGAGSCVSACPAGQTDCGGGCVDLDASVDHCGACGVTCRRPRASLVACNAPTCTIERCDVGYLDCDGISETGCEFNDTCVEGASCASTCGDTGVTDCSDRCAPRCIQPVESCNAEDDDCNGRCDDVPGCRVGVHRSFDPNQGASGAHYYTTDLAQASAGARTLERTDFFYLYSSDPGGYRTLYRCDRGSGADFLATSSACEGAGTVAETLGFLSPTTDCGSTPLYRLYRSSTNAHFYTTSAAERDNAVATLGFVFESVAGHVFANPAG